MDMVSIFGQMAVILKVILRMVLGKDMECGKRVQE